MDKWVTVQFWRLTPLADGGASFEQALAAAFALGPMAPQREREVGSGAIVRLERLEADGAFIDGEFARIQRDGLPHATGPEGLIPLEHDALGHAVAFRYSPDLRVLAMEQDKNAVSPRRMLLYLKAVTANASFSAESLENEDVWDRFDRGQPRRFSITMAAASNAAAVEGQAGTIAASI